MEIAIAIGVVLVILVIVANRKGNGIVVTPTSVSLTMEPVTTATISVHMMYTPFPRWFRSARRTQGTITVRNPGSIVQVTPTSAGTTHTAAAVFAVNPVIQGRGSLVFDGSSRHGAHDSALVAYSVT